VYFMFQSLNIHVPSISVLIHTTTVISAMIGGIFSPQNVIRKIVWIKFLIFMLSVYCDVHAVGLFRGSKGRYLVMARQETVGTVVLPAVCSQVI
jgi:hypothetical protein